jgi:hypothetical protein
MIALHSDTKAKIYLSGKRGSEQADGYQGFYTFNHGSYSAPDREPFFGIKALNDEVLKGQTVKHHIAREDSLVLLLPVVGGVKFRIADRESRFVEVDSCQLLYIPKNSVLEISNPYQHELINCITAWFSVETRHDYFEQFSLFNLQSRKNTLTEIFTTSTVKGYLGKFSGRTDHTFTLQSSSRGAFVFVVEGAFEVEKRLIEHRDGLALWNTNAIEFEALSNDAIILIVEL